MGLLATLADIQAGHMAAISHSLHLTVRRPAHPTKLTEAEGVLGECYITVEIAGPRPYLSVALDPADLRGMAGWVIARCVLLTNGIGGFITRHFEDLVRYTADPRNPQDTSSLATEIDFARYRKFLCIRPRILSCTNTVGLKEQSCAANTITAESTSFITVNVHGPGKGTKPGDTDPAIPVEIARINILKHEFYASDGASKRKVYNYNSRKFTQYAMGAVRGGDRPWWQPPRRSASDDMIYECDAGLGNPAEVDCSQVEWHQVKPPSDTLTVGPGNPTFLHSSTCACISLPIAD